MRRIFDSFQLAELLCFLGFWLCPIYAQAENQSASLALATSPQQSNFHITDAKGRLLFKGKTPYVGVLPAGQYRLVLMKSGFFTERRNFLVKAGQQKILQIKLMKKVTPITIRPSSFSKKSAASRLSPQKSPVLKRKALVLKRKGPVLKRKGPVLKRKSPVLKRKVSGLKVKKRKIPWIPIIAAGALTIASGVFFGLSGGSYDASKDKKRTQREAFQAFQQSRTYRSTATFLFVGAGTAVVLGALFYFWSPSKKKRRRRYLSESSTVVGFSASFSD